MTLPEQLDKLNKDIKSTSEKLDITNKKLEQIAIALGVKLPK